MRKLGRLTWRLLWLSAEVSFVAVRFAFLYLRTLGRPSTHQRAVCLHHGSRRVLRTFVDRIEVVGPRPTRGLLVSNHLSYLDILLLSGLSPGVFVSKSEVKAWPVFGWFAQLGGGTLYADPFYMDYAGYPAHRPLSKPAWTTEDGAPSLRFSGDGQYLVLPTEAFPRGAFTLAFWFKAPSSNTLAHFFNTSGALANGADDLISASGANAESMGVAMACFFIAGSRPHRRAA